MINLVARLEVERQLGPMQRSSTALQHVAQADGFAGELMRLVQSLERSGSPSVNIPRVEMVGR